MQIVKKHINALKIISTSDIRKIVKNNKNIFYIKNVKLKTINELITLNLIEEIPVNQYYSGIEYRYILTNFGRMALHVDNKKV